MYITIPRMITNNANKSSVKSTFTFFIAVPPIVGEGSLTGRHSTPASLRVVLPNSSPLELLFIAYAGCLCYAHMPLFKYSENASIFVYVKASTQSLYLPLLLATSPHAFEHHFPFLCHVCNGSVLHTLGFGRGFTIAPCYYCPV